jgi:hypothetical protein
MRLPKLKGFTNHFRTSYQVVNGGQLAERFPQGGPVGVAEIVAAGLVRSGAKVKVLGDGDLGGVTLSVTADAFSGSAREKIAAAGGSVTVAGAPAGTVTTPEFLQRAGPAASGRTVRLSRPGRPECGGRCVTVVVGPGRGAPGGPFAHRLPLGVEDAGSSQEDPFHAGHAGGVPGGRHAALARGQLQGDQPVPDRVQWSEQ